MEGIDSMPEQLGAKDVVGGDFNMVLKREERSGEYFSTSIVQNVKENIDKLGLEDLPLKGGR